MPPMKGKLSADETRAMQARKKAEKEELAKKEAEKAKKAAEKAEREKRQAAKKAEMAVAKKAKEEAKAGGGKPPGHGKEQELMKIVKRGEQHEEGDSPDYELALDCYREAMAGFQQRPKLLEKITRIEKLIEDEATC
jgi:hypothetical protein